MNVTLFPSETPPGLRMHSGHYAADIDSTEWKGLLQRERLF